MDSKLPDNISEEIVNLLIEHGINAQTEDDTLRLKFDDFVVEATGWNESNLRCIAMLIPGFRGSELDKLCTALKSLRSLKSKHVKLIRDWLNTMPDSKIEQFFIE